MTFIVAHEDSCRIAEAGPTQIVPVGTGFAEIATPCSCRAVKVDISFIPSDIPTNAVTLTIGQWQLEV